MVLLTIRVGLLVSNNLIYTTSHRFTKSSVPMVILNPINLRIQISHPVLHSWKLRVCWPCLAWDYIHALTWRDGGVCPVLLPGQGLESGVV